MLDYTLLGSLCGIYDLGVNGCGLHDWCNMRQYFEIFQRISFLVDKHLINANFIADTSDRQSESEVEADFYL